MFVMRYFKVSTGIAGGVAAIDVVIVTMGAAAHNHGDRGRAIIARSFVSVISVIRPPDGGT
jgi:hypothetical protein